MGKSYPELDERLQAFIGQQPVFFVATAPSGPGGHVNVSPKGYADTFAVLSPQSVAYLDLTGSGCETAAHLRENGRITVMFCAFSGPPKIVRLYGRGRVVAGSDPAFAGLATHFSGHHPGVRSVVVIDLERVADSCGYSVPVLELVGERDILDRSHERKGPRELRGYRARMNGQSIDGLPAFAPEPAD
jgi:hypothetical protein